MSQKKKFSILLIVLGVVLIGLKGLLGDTIDSNGILHEYFFLLPLGFGCIFVGLILSFMQKRLK